MLLFIYVREAVYNERRNILFIVLMGIICLIFGSCNSPKEETVVIEKAEEKPEEKSEEKSPEKESWIWVDVSGAVNAPGVYRLKEGSRVFEAIQEAGGFLENADTTGINEASVLSDGEKLQIYTVEEVQQMEMQPNQISASQENTGCQRENQYKYSKFGGTAGNSGHRRSKGKVHHGISGS